MLNTNDGRDVFSGAGERELRIMDKVRLVSDPSVIGLICNILPMGGITRYDVFIDGETRIFYTGQIEAYVEETQDAVISPDELRCFITAYLINKPSSESLYSMNSGRIDFIPYQFRPVLKLMKSDEPRILIADSVGVGKTIEAGLIIKELEAQKQIDSILIVCPKPLVAEEKWNREMERFDEHFVSVDKQALLRILDQNNRDGQWPAHSSKLVIPYSIMDEQLYEGSEREFGQHTALTKLDPPPHFDLVIIDEAHHIRNGSLEKEKAYNYKCVHYLCEHADAVVMLTATPIQNSDHDLYTLLNVLRPDVIVSPQVFFAMSAPNPAITACAHILRRQGENCQEQALKALGGINDSAWGRQVITQNPIYESVLARLAGKDLSRGARVQLIHDVESLHSFDCMINRTRRRDIQDFCVRRSYTISTAMTSAQYDLYRRLLDFEEEALCIMHGDKNMRFMTSTLRRQAASCIFGMAPCIQAMIDRRFNQIDDDRDDCVEGALDSAMRRMPSTLLARTRELIALAADIPEEDPKLASLLEIVREVNRRANNKILLFSSFRHTLAYLLPKLEKEGIRVAQVDGSVHSEDRLKIRKRFELDRDKAEALDMLLFTEVGSEGLDYQFCDTIVNYDLPWNPMRIEQRIGRIDRRGQKSDVVHIYNMITEDTVDADIYTRCLKRIGVFERSIGDCEVILGEISDKLEKIAYDHTLTKEELHSKLEQIADNEIRQIQELNRLEDAQKDLFGIALSEEVVSQEVKAAENPWLSPEHLRNLVTRYMQRYITGGRDPFLGQGDIMTIMLSHAQRSMLLDNVRTLTNIPEGIKRPMEAFLKGTERYHPVTFFPNASSEFEDIFVLNTVHPFVRLAANTIRPVGNATVHVTIASAELPEGIYPFEIYAWQYTGFKWRSRIVPICGNREIEKALVEILQCGSEDREKCSSEYDWEALEQLQLARWQEARAAELKSAQGVAAYRIGTLRTNSLVKQKALQKNIEGYSDNIRLYRMYNSMLQDEREKLEMRCAKVKQTKASTDIHTTLLAKGTVRVRRNER